MNLFILIFRKTNRLEESKNIFDSIVNNVIFRRVSIILFMNKTDLLADKLERKETNIKNYFPNFSGNYFNYKNTLNNFKQYVILLESTA